MTELYHKINGIYKRHREGPDKGKFIVGDFSCPEYSYLWNNKWVWTEKIDGTNIRVIWNHETQTVEFGGRSENSAIPAPLVNKLREMFPTELFETNYPDTSMTLCGEGYGAKIQKGGGRYISDGCSFIVFDIRIDKWWMDREAIEEITANLNVKAVPVVLKSGLNLAIEYATDGFTSNISEDSEYIAEGIVGTPLVPMFGRDGKRIIMKLKYKDFN